MGGAAAGLVSVTDVHGFPGGGGVKSRRPAGILRVTHGLLDLLPREDQARLPRLTRVGGPRRSLDALTQEFCEISNLPGILWVPVWFAIAKAATPSDSHEGEKKSEVTENKGS